MINIIVFLIRVVFIISIWYLVYSNSFKCCLFWVIFNSEKKTHDLQRNERQVVFTRVTNVCLAGGANNSADVLAFQLGDAFHGGDVTFQGT